MSDNNGLKERVERLEANELKIKAILNVIIDFMPNSAEVRAKVEDDQSSAGFLE